MGRVVKGKWEGEREVARLSGGGERGESGGRESGTERKEEGRKGDKSAEEREDERKMKDY